MTLGRRHAKRRKTHHFHAEWEEEYLFVMSKGKCICLICNHCAATARKAHLERHFLTHKPFHTTFPANSDLRKRKVNELKSQLAAQQSAFTQSAFTQSAFTQPFPKGQLSALASYRVSHMIAKQNRSLQDGELVKEAFLAAADCVFDDDSADKAETMEAIRSLQLSRGAVARMCADISEDLEAQLKNDIKSCAGLSLQFDYSTTDLTDVPQLSIFVRMAFDDMSAKEEFLTTLPLKEHAAGGEDVFRAFMDYVTEAELPLLKLVSMTTGDDGASVMVGAGGFIELCKQSSGVPPFLHQHEKSISAESGSSDSASLDLVVAYMNHPYDQAMDVERVELMSDKMTSLFGLDLCKLQMEIIDMDCDISVKALARMEPRGFWKLLCNEKYPSVRKCAVCLTALFGSAESAFSRMKTFMSQCRSTVTDDHLVASSRIATSSYNPDFHRLASGSQCNLSL